MEEEYIYVVNGNVGDYSGTTTWAIAAYLSEEEANYHAEKAQERYSELRDWKCEVCGKGYHVHFNNDKCQRPINQFDLPGYSISDIDYDVERIRVRCGKVPSEGWSE